MIKKSFFIFLLLGATICWGQDTATRVFKIRKIFATAAGRMGFTDTIDRQELADSGGIVIHGCTGCKVLGFQMMVKTEPTTEKDSLIQRPLLEGEIALTEDSLPRDPRDNILFSKTTMFTPDMKAYIVNISYAINTYYIEITDIKVRTQDGNILTLDKICLFLK